MSREELNLLFSTNRKAIPLLINCLRSIERFPIEDKYHVYILNSDLNNEDFEIIKGSVSQNIVINSVDVDTKLFIGFPTTTWYPEQIYYRILAAFLLPANLDKILYLDLDVVVINPLDKLYNMEFYGAYYVACSHVREFMTKVNSIRLGVKKQISYINSGVMLMDLEALRKQQNKKDIVDFVEENKLKLILPDQDIISALYGEKIRLVDTRIYNLSDRVLTMYNVIAPYYEKIDLDWVRENSVIIHYCGRNKPWKERYMGVLDVFYRELQTDSTFVNL